ncbi:CCR4-NOT transcription complex subunit 11-like [Schistocerca gregaria]|uniref:CCR4-NOT transcription complex subunit 11-like n=1 Tax=Schistocerca gregaria TaxID=7010 RepID=UPI00211F0700|nr:CCR4-NOT transcription complex subunit 11-like [Schistocerca gregaria]
MTSANQLEFIISILEEQESLESASVLFRRNVQECDIFVTTYIIYFLILDGLLINKHQKVVAYYLLYEFGRSGSSENLFLPSILKDTQESSSACFFEPWEKAFCHCLIQGIPDELYRKPLPDVIEWVTNKNFEYDMEYSPNPDLDKPSSTNAFQAAKLRFEVRIPNPKSKEKKLSLESLELGYLEPYFVRPTPSILEPRQDEILWITFSMDISFISTNSRSPFYLKLDPDMCENIEEICLFKLALEKPLDRGQLVDIVTELRKSPGFFRKINLTPEKLPYLVEKNPRLATQAFVQLIQEIQNNKNDLRSISDFWMTLVNTKISKQSMEVIASLGTVVEFPHEYLHFYISNCIKMCEMSSGGINQRHLVSMCCIFLQTLLRNQSLRSCDVFEVEHFCVTFIKEKEAANLFRLLKKHFQ